MKNIKKTERNSNIELLRILLILMVIGVHYNLIGMGNAFLYTRNAGINVSLTAVLESLCIVCVDTFIIITGYFQINKKNIDKEKVLKFILMILFFNAIQYFLNVFICNIPFNIKNLLLQTISGKWFIIVYLALYLLTPYINKLINALTTQEYKKMLIIILLLFVIYQTALNYSQLFIPIWGWSFIIDRGIDPGYNIINFIVLYLVGGYIRKSNINLSKKTNILGYFISTILIFISWYILYHSKYQNYANISFYYNNVLVLIASTSIFLVFKNIKIKTSKIINILASTTMGIFILSTSPFFIKLYAVLDVQKYSITRYLIPHFIITCITIFFACSVVTLIGTFILDNFIINLVKKGSVKMLKKIKKNKKIKVFFICQWKQGYIKFYDVVKCMIENEKIDVKLIAFPENIKEYPKNRELKFWQDIFGKDIVVNSVTDIGWFDLKKEKPDYVFVQRPYNNYLPEEYATNVISQYTKECYIPYGYGLVDIRDITISPEFLKQLYFYFAENKEEFEYAEKVMSTFKGNHKSLNIGYPMLDRELQNISNNKSAFENINSKDELRIIYTPRWTTNKDLYGTTFFQFKDKIIEYMNKNKNKKLVFRPHPLMFNNFIETGEMTQKGVEEYKKLLTGNITYDEEGNYSKTFQESDVLVTDFSSIILDYFILDKPIIICGNNDETKYFNIMKKISKACYKAKNWKEVEKLLTDISKGIDSKKKERQKIIKEIIDQNDGHVAHKITKCIVDDFYK